MSQNDNKSVKVVKNALPESFYRADGAVIFAIKIYERLRHSLLLKAPTLKETFYTVKNRV